GWYGRSKREVTYSSGLRWLLRPRRERPSGRRAAEQRDEVASASMGSLKLRQSNRYAMASPMRAGAGSRPGSLAGAAGTAAAAGRRMVHQIAHQIGNRANDKCAFLFQAMKYLFCD